MDKKAIIATIKQSVENLQLLYLFGSAANGQARADSDIDLAYLNHGSSLSTVAKWELSVELAELTGMSVDIVDLQSSDTVLQMQVVSTGERMYAADVKQAVAFESKTYWLYTTLNDDRRYILEDIRDSGSIYG